MVLNASISLFKECHILKPKGVLTTLYATYNAITNKECYSFNVQGMVCCGITAFQIYMHCSDITSYYH